MRQLFCTVFCILASGMSPNAEAKIITFDPPGSLGTYVINRNGVIAGFYVDGDNVSHGFLRTP